MMLSIILIGIGLVLIMAAIRGEDPRNIVRAALGREAVNGSED